MSEIERIRQGKQPPDIEEKNEEVSFQGQAREDFKPDKKWLPKSIDVEVVEVKESGDQKKWDPLHGLCTEASAHFLITQQKKSK